MSDDAFPAEWLENSNIPSPEKDTHSLCLARRWRAPECDNKTRRQPVWFIPEYSLDSAVRYEAVLPSY